MVGGKYQKLRWWASYGWLNNFQHFSSCRTAPSAFMLAIEVIVQPTLNFDDKSKLQLRAGNACTANNIDAYKGELFYEIYEMGSKKNE